MTPLQMAMVAAGIANGGVVMQPYVVEQITAPERRDGLRARSRRCSRARSRRRPRPTLTQMMESVVQAGTGTAAQIPGVAGRRQDRHRGDRRRRA